MQRQPLFRTCIMTSGGDVPQPNDIQFQSIGELPAIPTAYKLDGTNYLKWSQFVQTILKGRGRISHLTGPTPKHGDPIFESWYQEDAMIMAWMWSSMITEISDTCMFLPNAKDIWDALYQTYSRARHPASLVWYELKVKTMATKQGNRSVIEYANQLKSLWAELDYYRVIETKCPDDSAAIKQYIEQDRVYDLLAGLNPEFDQVRIQILGRLELPGFNEVVALLQEEESRRNLVLESQRSGQFKNQNPEDLGGTHCQETCHTHAAAVPPDEGITKEVQRLRALISSLKPSIPAFGAPNTPPFKSGSSLAFGQSGSAFGNGLFGTMPSFGAQSSSTGMQIRTQVFGSPGFGQSAFGGERRGSRVFAYSSTPEADPVTLYTVNLKSISASPFYKNKSHEQLRWEDWQFGDKGGPGPAGQATGSSGFGSSSTPAFCQPSANSFPSSSFNNIFSPGTPVSNSPTFGSSTTPAFGSSPFGTTTQAFGIGVNTNPPSLFTTSSTSALGVHTNPPSLSSTSGTSSVIGSQSSFSFGSTSAPGTGSFSFGYSQSSPLFQSTRPSSPFGQTSSTTPSTALFGNPLGFGQTTTIQSKENGSLKSAIPACTKFGDESGSNGNNPH